MPPPVRRQARVTGARIAAMIATIQEKTFAKPYLTSGRGIVARTQRSTPEMNASVAVVKSSEQLSH